MTDFWLPSVTSTWSNIIDNANPILEQFWPVLEWVVAPIVGFGIIGLIIWAVIHAFKH